MKNSIKYLIFYLAVFFVMPQLGAIMAAGFSQYYGVEISAAERGTIVNFAIYLILAVAAVIMLRDGLKKDGKKFETKMVFKGLLLGVVLLILEVAINYSAKIALHQTETTSNQSYLNGLVVISPVIMGITSILLAPFVEEIVYRRIILWGVKKKLGSTIGLLLSSLLFALAHMNNLDYYSLIVYGGLGLLLGWFYLGDRNVYENMIIHACHNAVVLYFMVLK